MVQAHRALLREALKDPFNQQFHLLCDTALPLRDPAFIYTQLIGHAASRITRMKQVSLDLVVCQFCKYRLWLLAGLSVSCISVV